MSMSERPTAKVFLQPGELLVTKEPTVITTVLGSCVSVTMHSPGTGVGGICHALLPKDGGGSRSEPFRFVDKAVSYMLAAFRKLGVERKDIEVKLFGGSDVLPVSSYMPTVGEQNVEEAFEIIERERLRLLAHDVRGEHGRKILFHTGTGEILLKRVKKSDTWSVS